MIEDAMDDTVNMMSKFFFRSANFERMILR